MTADEPNKPSPARQAAASISSEKLLGGRRQLEIRHNGELYTLRVTANNRLILTK